MKILNRVVKATTITYLACFILQVF